MKRFLCIFALAAALLLGLTGGASAYSASARVSQPEKVLTVTYDGGVQMQQAVEDAWSAQGSGLGGDKSQVTTLVLTGAAKTIGGGNWKYILEMFGNGATEWSGLHALDLSGMTALLEVNNNTGEDKSHDQMTSVVLPETLTTVGISAFYGCQSLTSLTLPDSVTVIRDAAFKGCHALKDFVIPEGVQTIEAQALNGCAFTSIEIPDGIEEIAEYTFYDCHSLTSVTIPGSVTSIGKSAFGNCAALERISIPDSVTSIGRAAFIGCTAFREIKIPDGIEEIEQNTFNGCTSLSSVTIPDSVIRIGNGAFYNCSVLERIEIPSGVTSIASSAFGGCLKLKDIVLPDGVKRIEDFTFANCSALKKMIIPDGVTEMGESVFSYCPELSDVTVPDSITAIGNNVFETCNALGGVTLAVSGNYTLTDVGMINSAVIPNDQKITAVVVKSGGILTLGPGLAPVPAVTLEAGGTVTNHSGGPVTVTLPDKTQKILEDGESLPDSSVSSSESDSSVPASSSGSSQPESGPSEPVPSQPAVSEPTSSRPVSSEAVPSRPVSSIPGEPARNPGPLDENGMRLLGRMENYAVTGGNGTVWTGRGPVEIRIDAPLSQFRELQWNGAALRQGVDFTLREGSTVITLLPEWLGTLADGTQFLSAVFEGGRAELELTVLRGTLSAAPDTAAAPPTPNPPTGTGEGIGLITAIAAALCTGCALFLVVAQKKRNR